MESEEYILLKNLHFSNFRPFSNQSFHTWGLNSSSLARRGGVPIYDFSLKAQEIDAEIAFVKFFDKKMTVDKKFF